MDHFGPENGTSPNSRSALGISFKFCTVKEDNRYIEILLMAFPKKKNLFWANGPFRTQNGASSQLWIHRKDCLKRAKRDMEIISVVFLKKVLFEAVWLFWPKNGTSA